MSLYIYITDYTSMHVYNLFPFFRNQDFLNVVIKALSGYTKIFKSYFLNDVWYFSVNGIFLENTIN